MSEQWQAEQDNIALEITRHRTADRSHIEDGVGLIDLARGAARLFVKQKPREQCQLLNFVLSNSIWQNGELSATFRQPFDLISETTAAAASGNDGIGTNSSGHPAWLGFLDAFRTICIAPSKEIREIFGNDRSFLAIR
jgi:hypothetical protein